MKVSIFQVRPRLGSVALETIHTHACKRVARLAKLAVGVHRNELPLIIFVSVTINAVDQAMLLGADALVHGLVALMHQELHVVPAHHFGIFHALLQLNSLCISGFLPVETNIFVRENRRR